MALEIGGLSLRDQHVFADTSFSDLLGPLASPADLSSATAPPARDGPASLLSIMLRRKAAQDGELVWSD